MPVEGILEVPSDPPHKIQIRQSVWTHRIDVLIDGRAAGGHLTWQSPGRDWSLHLPELPNLSLELQVRCYFTKLHWPHAHLLVAKCGESRVMLSPGWSDTNSLVDGANPPITV